MLNTLAIAQHGIGRASLIVAAQGFLASEAPTPTDFSTIGGGGGFKLFRERQDDDRKELRRAIKMAMGLVDDPRPEVREEAEAIIAAVSPGKPITQINQVNISLIMESRIKFEAILVHFERLKAAKLAEDEEDEEIALVLLN